ncbi:MAG: ATP-binding cassette domain-containing protein [Rhodospirillaceae bacterium]|jgi:phospholipid/cholesterol/gamma-HCH transport system ATP-binding protein|nr:ATP-binding cassette domain-containing protein [Rhodospirillaceae bacterium]MBT3884805.1 ATP-binding cassette domain-containing protein [Rhodospirillaceae bacterium]MBT4118859.1 ATP-binding cassette domain-containing protein [Rhodospirillaceae bacterium]MBT4671905.1 ATP-binding cassette domain-containing protein [Rhodospirillaceae bacterium]MBT4718798.1 ATP-binding cassette domain-containing protein [Rhodospirillaceae bacterium]
MAETETKILMKGVRKAFGPKVILDDFNLDIKTGESMVVIGGSGVGKSVMLKCLLGVLTPESGAITIDGDNVVGIGTSERDRVNAKLGMLFQGAALFDSQTVWENVAFGLTARKVPREEAREIAMQKIAMVGLKPEIAETFPSELSGGMKKRVGLARAIAADPEIIFFDEPTTGLDPLMGDIINDLIVHCVEETGATTLTITHDMLSARKIGDRISMIYGGKIIWAGPTGDIDDCDNEYVQQFINGRTDGPIQMAVRD